MTSRSHQGASGSGGRPDASISSGIQRVDTFVATSFESMAGMSSSLSVLACATILKAQVDSGMYGHVAEIGVFEGKFLIPLAFGLAPEEIAIAIDTFDWPDPAVRQRFQQNIVQGGVVRKIKTIVSNSGNLVPHDILGESSGFKIRFIHIDGDHKAPSLHWDLKLAANMMEPWGVICVDDMLSPAYPLLGAVVEEFLRERPDLGIFCIVDRENIVASTKFLISHRDIMQFYCEVLSRQYPACIWPMGGQFTNNIALVLSRNPLLYRYIPGGGFTRI